jgi:hypothetical protein
MIDDDLFDRGRSDLSEALDTRRRDELEVQRSGHVFASRKLLRVLRAL